MISRSHSDKNHTNDGGGSGSGSSSTRQVTSLAHDQLSPRSLPSMSEPILSTPSSPISSLEGIETSHSGFNDTSLPAMDGMIKSTTKPVLRLGGHQQQQQQQREESTSSPASLLSPDDHRYTFGTGLSTGQNSINGKQPRLTFDNIDNNTYRQSSFITNDHEYRKPSATPNRSYLSLHNLNINAFSMHHISKKLDDKIAWRQRLKHFTWNFFSMTMATGGLASVIHSVPFRFRGLDTIGTILFLFNFIIFVINCILILLRFVRFPGTLTASVTHPTESLFMPAAVVSLGLVLHTISQYGLDDAGDWLGPIVVVLFWLYVGLAMLASASTYLLIWSTQTFTISQMTPIWVFPAYPLLIVGSFAGYLGQNLQGHGIPAQSIFNIIIGGFLCQGVGFIVSMTIYSCFIYRLMTQKLPKEPVKPAIFISVGPCGFTASAMVNLAAGVSSGFPDDFLGDGHLAATIVKVVAYFASLWFWGTAVWFFIISVGAHWTASRIRSGQSIEFAMVWFSFVFPNSALVSATFGVGKAFRCVQIQWVGCILTIILFLVWLFIMIMMIRGIILKQVLWPQKQEDRDEGGYVASSAWEAALEKKAFKSQHNQEDMV